jgi:DNA-binding SARP family transcriptional activator
MRDRSRSSRRGATQLRLSGDFELVVAGQKVALPHALERVLAYLALAEHPVSRTRVAGTLWADVTERRAISNLRTVLWRMDRIDPMLVARIEGRLALGRYVDTDIKELGRSIRRLIVRKDDEADDEHIDLARLIHSDEILIDWDDDWLVADRERLRLLRLEALERAAESLLLHGELSQALEVAIAVTAAEPLRESARRLMAEIQIGQGNIAEVLRGYDDFRNLLRSELGLEPTPALEAIVTSVTGPFTPSPSRPRRTAAARSR